MEEDKVFRMVVSRVFPAVILADIDSPPSYSIGNVLYHSAKPTIVSWRKQKIQFATADDGSPASLESVLLPESRRILGQIRPQFTFFSNNGSRDTTKELRFDQGGQTRLVRASFSSVYQTTSNLLGLLESTAGELRVDPKSAVVRRVADSGGQCFVVSTVYQCEKVEINERVDSDSGETWKQVVSKTDKTVLGFLLIRLSVSSETGIIKPVWHGGYTPHTISIEESEDGLSDVKDDFEDIDSGYAYRQCGRRELQVFQSDTYAGVIEEAARFVEALAADSALQKAFIEVVQTPGSALRRLSQELQSLQEKIVMFSVDEGSKSSSFPELLGQLSTPTPQTLDKVKALGFATEAFKELSPVTSKQILSLTSEERTMLLDLFRELPMASSAHVFHRPAFSEANLLYSQILSKIGFGSSGGNLSYEADDVRCVDLIAVTITAIQATVGTP